MKKIKSAGKLAALSLAAVFTFSAGPAIAVETAAPAVNNNAVAQPSTVVPTSAVSATDAVKGSINELLRILEDPALKQAARSDEKIRLLEKTAAERFDYTEMSRRTLGSEWAKLDDGQKKEFVDVFQKFLSATYVDRLQGYSGDPIDYLSERREGDYAEVRTKVNYNKAEVPMDYRLMNKAGNWRVYDVVIDGVSVVANYRGQFTKIIRQSSYDDLLKQLKAKSQKRAEGPSQPKIG